MVARLIDVRRNPHQFQIVGQPIAQLQKPGLAGHIGTIAAALLRMGFMRERNIQGAEKSILGQTPRRSDIGIHRRRPQQRARPGRLPFRFVIGFRQCQGGQDKAAEQGNDFRHDRDEMNGENGCIRIRPYLFHVEQAAARAEWHSSVAIVGRAIPVYC